MQIFTDINQTKQKKQDKSLKDLSIHTNIGLDQIAQFSNTQLRCKCTHSADKVGLAPPTGRGVSTFCTGVYSYPVNQK